jgi:hypothetical protein
MKGTTPPCEMTTSPRSLFNLPKKVGHFLVPKNLKSDILFIIPDCELQVTRDNTLLLIITSCIASKLENFCSQILKNGSEINWRKMSQIATTEYT